MHSYGLMISMLPAIKASRITISVIGVIILLMQALAVTFLIIYTVVCFGPCPTYAHNRSHLVQCKVSSGRSSETAPRKCRRRAPTRRPAHLVGASRSTMLDVAKFNSARLLQAHLPLVAHSRSALCRPRQRAIHHLPSRPSEDLLASRSERQQRRRFLLRRCERRPYRPLTSYLYRSAPSRIPSTPSPFVRSLRTSLRPLQHPLAIPSQQASSA